MAAVQATPAMQQQQGNNANMSAQANAILPPGMTKEAVQQIYKVSVYFAVMWIARTLTCYIEISADEGSRRARD